MIIDESTTRKMTKSGSSDLDSNPVTGQELFECEQFDRYVKSEKDKMYLNSVNVETGLTGKELKQIHESDYMESRKIQDFENRKIIDEINIEKKNRYLDSIDNETGFTNRELIAILNDDGDDIMEFHKKSMGTMCITKYVYIDPEIVKDKLVDNDILSIDGDNEHVDEESNDDYVDVEFSSDAIDSEKEININNTLNMNGGSLSIHNVYSECEWDYDDYKSDPSGVSVAKKSPNGEYHIKLLRKPIVFLEEFGSLDDGNTIYGVIIDGKMMYKTRKEIESILFDRGYCCERSRLSDTISAIIAHDRECGTMVHRESYECIGVHVNIKDKSKLTVAYPQVDDIRIIPQDGNPLFEESLNDVLKYDISDGHEIANSFFNAMSTFDPYMVGIVAGWACSSSFYYVLRNTKIDVFPMLVMHGNSGTGKSKLLELFTLNMFGLPAKPASSFDTSFRFDVFRALSTIPIVVEEMDEANDDIKSAIKSSSASSSQGSFRGTASQQVIVYKTRTPIIITSNNPSLWEGDTAIRNGRSIFVDVNKKMYDESEKSIELYKKSINEITKSNKLFGYFFLNEVVKTMNNEEIETNSKYLKSILEKSEYIDAIGRLNLIVDNASAGIRKSVLDTGMDLADDRRFTIWGLAEVGLIFLHHVYSTTDENGKMASAEGAKYVEEILDDFTGSIVIPNQEKVERTQITMLGDISTFIELVTKSSRYPDADEALFITDIFGSTRVISSYCLTTVFKSEYVKWANQAKAKEYKTVKILASELANIFDIGIETIYRTAYNENNGERHLAVRFPVLLADTPSMERILKYKSETTKTVTLLDILEALDSESNISELETNEIDELLDTF